MCTLNENSKYAENVGRYAINSKTYEENSVNWKGHINCYFEYKIDNWQSNFHNFHNLETSLWNQSAMYSFFRFRVIHPGGSSPWKLLIKKISK